MCFNFLDTSIIKSYSFPKIVIEEASLDEIEDFHHRVVKTHLQWQNDFDFMRFFMQIGSYKVVINNEIVAAFSLLPVGKVFYLYVDSKYRGRGYAKALFAHALALHQMAKFSISFPLDENLQGFLVRLGSTKDTLSQFDMVLPVR